MKTEKNILVAFILNLSFSIFEIFGGIITGSVAVISDAIHDIGDAVSIGCSYFLERKSKKQPDESHTYGYVRYSVLGGLIGTFILLLGSVFVIYNAILRLIDPIKINYNGMIVFAFIGVIVNFCAAFFTRHGDSLNQRSVNLHMLEDVFGWLLILIGSIIMKFTDISIIDPILSILLSLFILFHVIKQIRIHLDIFLEKTPRGLSVKEIQEHLCQIEGVLDIHHIHIRSLDGYTSYMTLHAKINSDPHKIKAAIREELSEHGITHVTIETEGIGEECSEQECQIKLPPHVHIHHH